MRSYDYDVIKINIYCVCGRVPSSTMARQCDCMGLLVSCTHEDALSSYNKALRAQFTLQESPAVYLQEACRDPSFALAHCFSGCLHLLGLYIPPADERVTPNVAAVQALSADNLTQRERDHVKALLEFASGSMPQAVNVWSSILVEHPHDILALSLLYRACVWLGQFEQQRDTISRLLPHWRRDMELYPFLMALYAYSLEETNFRQRGEQAAREALEANPRVPQAYHAMSHVIEEEKGGEEGVAFLSSSRQYWSGMPMDGHLAWHLALFQLDLGDSSAVLQEYDSVLSHKVDGESLFGLLDAASLLWRLSLAGVDPGEERWGAIVDKYSKHIGKHTLFWFDAHLMLALAHGQVSQCAAQLSLAQKMLKSMHDYAQQKNSTNCTVTEQLGLPLCNALMAYSCERYDEVLSLLLPLRHRLVGIGGSWAQRQVFVLTGIQAAVKSGQPRRALAMAAELKAQKPNCQWLNQLFKDLHSAYERGTPD